MNVKNAWKNLGPGLIVAATGLGAGDIVAAAVAGAQYGTTLVWVALAGGFLKFCLNEGIGRWQLVTGTTLLEGWFAHLPKFVTTYFVLYLILWSFMVAAAMMAATGLGAYALWPVLSPQQWGALHAVVTLAIVWSGRWVLFEGLMKFCIALMFVAVLACAALVLPDAPGLLADMFRPSIPEGNVTTVVSVMGGVGGSVTIMSYGYWMREAGWKGSGMLKTMRWDLGVSYLLTALFAASVIVLAAGVRPEVIQGNGMAVAFAEQLVPYTGETGKWLFLLGFWGAVWSSMLGVWHGVPYLFANVVGIYREGAQRKRGQSPIASAPPLTRTPEYRGFLLFMAIVPMLLLIFRAPVQVVRLYTITGAMFMPLLAILLLYLNRPRWLGAYANGKLMQASLALCLVLFLYLLFTAPSA
ncbi:MAG: Nramp family divalent metal transporter [Pseudomonadota bacterium]|nr:Nramp family divalent metal transporter [Pseudomonadota bacterium]